MVLTLKFWRKDLQGKYKEIYDSSIGKKENFWKEVAENIFWYKKPSKILDLENNEYIR